MTRYLQFTFRVSGLSTALLIKFDQELIGDFYVLLIGTFDIKTSSPIIFLLLTLWEPQRLTNEKVSRNLIHK